MDRNIKEPSISPTPDSDTTGHSVQTIIPNINGQLSSPSSDNNKRIDQRKLPEPDEENNSGIGGGGGHLYNTLADLSTPGTVKEKPTFSIITEQALISQNPQPNNNNNKNTRAASTSTLLTNNRSTRFQLHIWLGVVQLFLSVALTALGGLVLARSAALASVGAGIWSGGICGITGALGVINVRKTQTGFLAVSLICVASSTLAIALTGIGLVRDYNRSPATNNGAVSASSGLLTALALHFIVSVLSIYFLAVKLCLRPNSNNKTVNDIATANNSTYLSQQRLEQYFKSLTIDSKRKNGYPVIINRNILKSASEKNFNTNGDKAATGEIWLSTHGRKLASPVLSHSQQMILVPAGIRNSVPIIPIYTSQLLPGSPTVQPRPPQPPPRPIPSIMYPAIPPGFLPYHQPRYPIPTTAALAMENELHPLDAARIQRQLIKDRRMKHQRRKSDSDIDARKAFTYTGIDRVIAENFLEHQEKFNSTGSTLDNSTINGSDELGKCPDVAM